MSFYPKHLKKRRERDNLRLVAAAALAGCTFVKQVQHVITGYNYNGDPTYRPRWAWCIRFPTGGMGSQVTSKRCCAERYLLWFYAYGEKEND